MKAFFGWPLTLCVTAFLSVACEGPLYPKGAISIEPLAVYGTLWRTVESCSGLEGNLGALRWYSTPGSASPTVHGAAGSWWPDGNRIYLNEAYLDNPAIVRHEMLHALESRLRHSSRFQNACGGLVTCVGPCVTEAGANPVGPIVGSPVLMASALTVEVVLLSPQVGDSGYTTVLVKATNPFDYPVWVQLDHPQGVEFICRRGVQPCGDQASLGPGALAGFGAGQMRQMAFVFSVSSGTYQIVAGYDNSLSDTLTLIVP